MAEGVRYGLLLRTSLEVLRDASDRMRAKDVLDEVHHRVDLTEAERQIQKSGVPAWIASLGFFTAYAATAGWIVKRDGWWWITDAGRAQLERRLAPEDLYLEVTRRYGEVFRNRKQARKKYEAKLTDIEKALELVPAGSWTSHEDLADLVGGTAEEIAHLLAEQLMTSSYRVLDSDGRIPEAKYQHASYRGTDLMKRLSEEGVVFDARQAQQDQRITADLLANRIAEVSPEPEGASRRGWLVRGSNVDGVDLVGQWLAESWVSLSGSQLVRVPEAVDQASLVRLVDDKYRHKSYSVREKLAANFAAFLRLMDEGDYVITTHQGDIYLGVIDGAPYFTESPDRRSNLRRPVQWLNADAPRDITELSGPLPVLIQSQDDVIDLTDALDQLESLFARVVPMPTVAPPPREAELAQVSSKIAADLLLDLTWLQDVRDLLAERRQLILYGPPGTGKTYLAHKLAATLTESHAVELIQFHPSYTYEDFFEGFRPESTEDGTLRFKLTPGPLRKLADEAREHPSIPYILIIDEINRGNLAKIFGELYFLLEYRDQRIRLQYSPEDFTLPKNLYVIGTMNTADRSIAALDAAMRRRFAFIEMHPTKPPVAGLLRRWLERNDIESDAPDLLDALNQRLVDADYAIGPSYLMRESLYAKPDGLDRVWRHDLLPLLVEHHFADDIDVEARYGLDSLRAGGSSAFEL